MSDSKHNPSVAVNAIVSCDKRIEQLKNKVGQFNALGLPGQPLSMHMGTSYLINDLWQEIKNLRDIIDSSN